MFRLSLSKGFCSSKQQQFYHFSREVTLSNHGGSLVVSEQSFFSYNLGSNLVQLTVFFCTILFEKVVNKQKETGVDPAYKIASFNFNQLKLYLSLAFFGLSCHLVSF